MLDWLAKDHVNVDLSLSIISAQIVVMRTPCKTPVRTSFGTMIDRPAVFLQLETSDGVKGLGEIWCNFPSCGAEHRARLLQDSILPAVMSQTFKDPATCFNKLSTQFERLAIQSGEFGPIAQCIAGIDCAIWDIVAKRANASLYQIINGKQSVVKTYASGINPSGSLETVERCRDLGYTAFKLKIGFGDDTDLRNLKAIADSLRDSEQMMTDVNQGWSIDKTIEILPKLAAFPLKWLEEPIIASSPASAWEKIQSASSIPLAAGENIMGTENFNNAISYGHLDIIQPDICKWGGISGNLPIIKNIIKSGARYCPHYLGGGIGLATSAHLLAAVGGDGLLEIDSNINPLREDLFAPKLTNGKIDISNSVGIGINDQHYQDFLSVHSKTISMNVELKK